MCGYIGGSVIDGHCLKYKLNVATFEEALTFCEGDGGHLSVPNSSWLESQFGTDFIDAFGRKKTMFHLIHSFK